MQQFQLLCLDLGRFSFSLSRFLERAKLFAGYDMIGNCSKSTPLGSLPSADMFFSSSSYS